MPAAAADINESGTELSTRRRRSRRSKSSLSAAARISALGSGTYVLTETRGWKIAMQKAAFLSRARNNGRVPINSGSCIDFAKCCWRRFIKRKVISVVGNKKMKTGVQGIHSSMSNTSLPNQLHPSFLSTLFSKRNMNKVFLFPFAHCISELWAPSYGGPISEPMELDWPKSWATPLLSH